MDASVKSLDPYGVWQVVPLSEGWTYKGMNLVRMGSGRSSLGTTATQKDNRYFYPHFPTKDKEA
jgi:hypothetical protein